MTLSEIVINNLPLAQEYAEKMGKITAQEALAIGINWILAPVTDVNNNPQNPVINVRAFGDNPQIVADLATAFIRGCQSLPILTTAKHFPGHGDTVTDSHLDLPRLSHSLTRLTQVELVPFQRAINEGVDTIMTAHLLVEALDNINPATLSYSILTEQLRVKMGFAGLIVTDALIMGGVAKYASPEEIAVKAIQAGADILLMPENPEIAINSIEQAINNGILSEARIDRSLARIAQAKDKLFSATNSIKPFAIDAISTPESRNTVNAILSKSIRKGGQLPLNNPSRGINLLVVDSLLGCDFLEGQTPAIAIPETFNYQTQIIEQKNRALAKYEQKSLLLQIFIRGNPFRGSAGLTSAMGEFYQQLLKQNKIEALVIYGSPYVLDWFLSQLSQDTPWLFTYGQMPSAQAIVCQNLFNLSQEEKIKKGNFL